MLKLTACTLAASAAFFGCKKDDVGSPLTAAEEVDVTPRIKAFVQRAQLMDQRDNVPITLDSAEWYIEAALNLTVAQTWLECTNFRTDSLEYSIGSDAGMIASDVAYAAFLSFQAQASGMITPDENHLVVADVMFLPSDDGAYTIKVLLQFGSGYEKVLNTSYGPNDYWYFGYDLANCGCGPNQSAS